MDGKLVRTIRPQGRFKAENGVALLAAALEGVGVARIPNDLTERKALGDDAGQKGTATGLDSWQPDKDFAGSHYSAARSRLP